MRGHVILVASMALAMGMAAPADAAAPWSLAAPVFGPADSPTAPSIAYGGDGRAVVVRAIDTFGEGDTTRTQVAARSVAGVYRRTQTLAGAVNGQPPEIEAYGRSRMVLVRAIPRPLNNPVAGPVRLVVSFGRTNGRFAPGRALARYRQTFRVAPAVAATDRGRVAVAWVQGGSERDILRLAVRRPNGRFGRARMLRTGRISALAMDLGEGGDLLVTYRRGGRIEARVQRAGKPMGAVQDLGVARQQTELTAAVAPTGRMLVAWGERVNGGRLQTPYVIRAAIHPAGPRRFRAATVLDDSASQAGPTSVVAAIGPDGTATVAWCDTRFDGQRFINAVMAATTGSDARFATPEQLAPDGTMGDVAINARGTAIVTWTHTGESGILAAQRARGARFGPPEVISTTGLWPVLAIDPRRIRPTILWHEEIEVPTAPGQFPESRRSVSAATRTTG